MTTPQEPKVSIVLPVYNGARFLSRAIDSCLGQTYKNIELIIVDDCSTDETPTIVKRYTDPRLRYHRNATNQRLPRSLNIGFSLAQGEFLTWTSDDNEFLPTAIEEMLDFLSKNPVYDFVYADMVVRNLETGEEKPRKLSHDDLEIENNIGACYIYTRRVLKEVGDYDPRWEWLEDYDYWLRINKKFRIAHLPKVLYIYGDHGKSLTSVHYYAIAIFRSILLNWHGYYSRAELKKQVRVIWRKILYLKRSRSEIIGIWKSLLRKAFGVSFSTGVSFLAVIGNLLSEKVINRIAAPFINKRSLENIDALKVDPSKENVLCFVPSMVFGGSEKVLEMVVLGFKKEGYDFHLVCNKRDDNPWVKRFAACFKNVVLFPEEADHKVYQQHLPKIIRKLRPRLLLATNSWAFYQCLPEIKKEFLQIKAVDIVHLERVGGDHSRLIQFSPYVDERVCISRHLKDHMTEEYRTLFPDQELASRISVIYNGTDDEFFHYPIKAGAKFRERYNVPTDAKVVTFIGRFTREKKPLVFVELAKRLTDEFGKESLHFLMAGGGPFQTSVLKRVEELGIQGNFHLTGVLADVRPLLSQTSVLVLLSDHEGIPLVIHEAMAMGVPVVSTNAGAVREIIKPGVNGYIVPVDDNISVTVFEKLSELLGDQKKYDAIAEQTSGSIIPNFTMSKMLGSYRKIFQKLLSAQPAKEARR